MRLRRIPWPQSNSSTSADAATEAPREDSLRQRLEAEGWEVHLWKDPSERVYADHTHQHDESLWLLRGDLVVEAQGESYPLRPGDRLILPKGTVRKARAGPDGAIYLIGRRFEDA